LLAHLGEGSLEGGLFGCALGWQSDELGRGGRRIDKDASPAVLHALAQGFDGGGFVDGGEVVYDALGRGGRERGFDLAPVLGKLGPGTGETLAVRQE
jgi:hypothetical protein